MEEENKPLWKKYYLIIVISFVILVNLLYYLATRNK